MEATYRGTRWGFCNQALVHPGLPKSSLSVLSSAGGGICPPMSKPMGHPLVTQFTVSVVLIISVAAKTYSEVMIMGPG